MQLITLITTMAEKQITELVLLHGDKNSWHETHKNFTGRHGNLVDKDRERSL